VSPALQARQAASGRDANFRGNLAPP
jgi:hypothetical protein